MVKRRISKILVSAILVVALTLSSTTMAFACTGIYFGKDVTENGSTIMGRSEDSPGNPNYYIKNYNVVPAATHAEGEMFYGMDDFAYPYPAKTLRYTMVRDYSGDEYQEYVAAGTNEKGVAVTSSVTLSGYPNAIRDVDPMMPYGSSGLEECDVPTVILMQATTAREGAQVLLDAYEKYGAVSRDCTIISDPDETWFVESLSGHNAVAAKAPDHMVGVTPNITGNLDLSDKKNTLTTKNLVSVAEQAGTIKRDENGQMLVADSYATKPSGGVLTRLWQGYYYLRDQAFADSNAKASPNSEYMNMFVQPRKEKNYTLYEALRLLAFRGEGTSKYAGTGATNAYGIGNDYNLENHVFETRHDKPDELATVQWLSLSPPEFSVYLPGYNALVTETIAENSIGLDTMAYDPINQDANSYRTVFYKLHNLCKGVGNDDGITVASDQARTKYGKGVKDFWATYQKELIAQQAEVDVQMEKILEEDYDLATEKATALNMHLQKEALGYAKQMVNELIAYMEDDKGLTEFKPSALTSGKLPTNNMDAVKTDAEKSRESAAKTELNNAANLTAYRDAEKTEISEMLDAANDKVEKAITQDEVNKIISDFKADIADYKTAARYNAEETAIEELYSYVDPSEYDEIEQGDINAIIGDAEVAIQKESSESAFPRIVADAKRDLDLVPTLAEKNYNISRDALDLKKTEAINSLGNYVDLADYRSEQRSEIAKLIAAGQVLINSANNEDYIALVLTIIKGDIDLVKTDAQLTAIESQMFKVTARASVGGKITPSAEHKYGTDATYKYTPNKGYTVAKLTVDGKKVGSSKTGGTYTFKNIKANHTIKADFSKIKYKVSVNKSKKGKVVCRKTVNYGDSYKITVKPKKGYKLAKLTVNKKAVKVNKKNIVIIKNVTKNQKVKASFKKI